MTTPAWSSQGAARASSQAGVPGDRVAAEVPNLATSVDNLANRLGAAGHRAERLTARPGSRRPLRGARQQRAGAHVHAGGSRRGAADRVMFVPDGDTCTSPFPAVRWFRCAYWASTPRRRTTRAGRAARRMGDRRVRSARAPDQLVRLVADPASDQQGGCCGPSLALDPTGQPVVTVALCWCGPHDDGHAVLEPLRSYGRPIFNQVGPVPYADWQSGPDVGFPSGRLHYWKAGWLRDLTDASVTTLLDRLQTMGHPHSAGSGCSTWGVPQPGSRHRHRIPAPCRAVRHADPLPMGRPRRYRPEHHLDPGDVRGDGIRVATRGVPAAAGCGEGGPTGMA